LAQLLVGINNEEATERDPFVLLSQRGGQIKQ
jgi:hypothetical protein